MLVILETLGLDFAHFWQFAAEDNAIFCDYGKLVNNIPVVLDVKGLFFVNIESRKLEAEPAVHC